METYAELLDQMKRARTGKECRTLHRKLKKYGDGISFRDRYPNFYLTVSAIALLVSVAVFIQRCLGS